MDQIFLFLPDSKGEPLYIVNSSNVSDGTLLKMLFTKVPPVLVSFCGCDKYSDRKAV